jgi:hypothetical protein
MVINYKPRPLAPLLAFSLFVVMGLLVAPIWYLHHSGLPVVGQLWGGRVLVAPLMGIFCLALVAKALRFNARVRREPRAMQWDGRGISLWRDGRTATFAWPQVGPVSIRKGARAGNPNCLDVTTEAPGGAWTEWRFLNDRLQLAGQSLPGIAGLIEQARAGGPAFGSAAPADADLAAQQRQDAATAARGWAAILFCLYFATFAAMLLYLASSHATLLTPTDPRLWAIAKVGFMVAFAAVLLWYVKLCWNVPLTSSAMSIVPAMLMSGVVLGAMTGGWAYVAAEIVMTVNSLSGPVEHRTAFLSVRLDGRRHNHPIVRGQLLGQPGRDVSFTIDAADEALIERAHIPGRRDQPWCLALPVEVAGRTIRTEASEDVAPPAGSIRACS